MIWLYLTNEAFEQDIRPLVKSFFPKEELRVTHAEDAVFENVEGWRKRICGIWRENGFELMIYRETSPETAADSEEKEVSFSNRRLFRDEVKRAVYRLLLRETGEPLPWGTLTGVRPVKPVLERLEAGQTPEEIDAFLQKEFYVSEEKRRLALAVAAKEKELLEKIDDKNSYSLYLGIPFCPTTCLYCSFTSYPLAKFGRLSGEYIAALKKEIRESAGLLKDTRLATVYFGGGTPTALSAEELREVIRCLKEYFPVEAAAEWTVEAGRPDSITEEKLQMLLEEGVGRISINPQTMNQKTLDLIGRRHTAGQIREAFALARKVGFTNINMDLIIGLTGENAEDVKETLRQIGELSPDSVTVHTLARKRAARLNIEKEQYLGMDAVRVLDMLAASVRFARENGYLPYYLYRQKNMEENLENVGYAREGKEGLYNVLIMEEKQSILALGAGAASKRVYPGGRIERCENVKDLTSYLARIDEMIERKKRFFAE